MTLSNLEERLARVDTRLAALTRLERRYPWLRLLVFGLGLAASIAAFTGRMPAPLPWLVLLLSAAAFAVTAGLHNRVLNSLERFQVLRRLTLEQIARARLDWAQIPLPGSPPMRRDHPFAIDLDIIGGPGAHTLHALLDVAASTGGSRRLLDWLLEEQPDPQRTQARQALVRSLIPRSGFRGRLHLSGALVAQELRGRWDGEQIQRWLDAAGPSRGSLPLLLALSGLAAVNLAVFVLVNLGRMPAGIWLAGLALFWALQGLRYRETSEAFSEAAFLARGLERFRAVLVELERYPYPAGDPLREVCRPLWEADSRPSRALRSLGWVVTGASFRSNPMLGLLLNTVLPWDLFFTYQLERIRARLRHDLPRWLDAWYELDALHGLANFAVLNPAYTFPTLQANSGEPVFAARAIGHPLLPAATRVCNDFSLARPGEIVIVTGSNMSGKSTFLRTLGVNLALAYAGGPVCAGHLRSAYFRLYTSININDSLSDGISYFYAEVRRLKALLDALQTPGAAPLFFLIDEIFRGTNNRERQIGSLAYTRALAGGNGVGLISTHDLELAHLADEIAGIRNLHFREDVRDGRMVFDYRLREGPSPTTNALKIMAIEGLPVGERRSTR